MNHSPIICRLAAVAYGLVILSFALAYTLLVVLPWTFVVSLIFFGGDGVWLMVVGWLLCALYVTVIVSLDESHELLDRLAAHT